MFSASKSGKLPGTPDPQFNYVTALLHGDGTNGAQNNTFLDSSSNAFTVTRGNTPTQGSFSPYGSLWSNYFGGSGNYLSSSSTTITLSGNLTFECWVNFSNVTTSNLIIFFSDSTTGSYQFGFSNGNLYFTTAYPYTVSQSSPTYVASTWSHIAAVRSGTTLSIYVNGTRVGTATSATSFIFAGQHIGVYSQNTALYNPIGYISNLRITNTAVYDPTQTSLTVPTAPLTAITGTQLLTCQSNRFVDNSSSNIAFTPNSTPSVQRFNPLLPTYLQAYSTSVYGGSAYFNGTADYLTLPSNAAFAFGTGNFTLEAWVYLTSFNAYNEIIASRPTNGSNSADLYSFGVDNTGSIFMFSASFLVQSSASAIKLNTWTHVALVRSGTGSSQTVIYVNGISTATGTVTNNLTGSTCSIGGLGNGQEPFYGYISDARVVKGTAVYTGTFTPNTAPLTAISGTSYLGSMTNGAIYDNAMMNDLLTVGSAQISTSVKKYGTGSLSFNGTTDYLTTQTNPAYSYGTGNFTIEFWVNVTTLPGGYTYLYAQSANSGSSGLGIYLQGTIKIFAFGANRITGTTTIATNTWYHVALSRSGTSTKLFVNGTQEGSTYTDSNSYATGSSYGYSIANWTEIGDTFFFSGYIDDVRITKGYARYTSNFTPPTTALPNYGS